MLNRDIIVVGASAGGIEATSDLLVQLPEDIKAAVFVVIHTTSEADGMLASVLDRRCALQTVIAKDEDKISYGNVYVAPPDNHIMLLDGRIRILHGPKENRFRPAIDPLFRSAAVTFSSRVIGIILSGLLYDGVSGLNAIKKCGGIAITQKPEEALFPDLPVNTIANIKVDHVLSVKRMGSLINQLISESVKDNLTIPTELKKELTVTKTILNNTLDMEYDRLFTCPECNGPLLEVKDNILRYRCATGHAYTAEDLLISQNESFEAAIFAALRMLEEHANMLEGLAEINHDIHIKATENYNKRAKEAKNHAKILRDLLLNRK